MKDIFIKAATNQPVLGGEMEGYGLFKECQGFECLVPCLLIKSICDWGAYKNIDDETVADIDLKDKIQAYAARQAYKVLSILMKKEAEIVEDSIYEQVKQFVFNLKNERENMLLKKMLTDLLDEKLKTFKTYKNIEKLCKLIFDELEKEGVIKKAGAKTTYRII